MQMDKTVARPRNDPVDPTITELIIVRHGETEWNADERIQGHIDVELNNVGREQASLVASRIARELKISAVYSSDLKRASVTAEAIARSSGIAEVFKDPNLRERHLGNLQGLRLREASELYPVAYKAFLSRKTNQEIPGGGESVDQLFDRCTSCVEQIAKKHRGERVVIVSHGGAIRQLYQRASPSCNFRGKVLNASFNIFCLSDDDKWTIKTWADITHLTNKTVRLSGFGGDSTSG